MIFDKPHKPLMLKPFVRKVFDTFDFDYLFLFSNWVDYFLFARFDWKARSLFDPVEPLTSIFVVKVVDSLLKVYVLPVFSCIVIACVYRILAEALLLYVFIHKLFVLLVIEHIPTRPAEKDGRTREDTYCLPVKRKLERLDKRQISEYENCADDYEVRAPRNHLPEYVVHIEYFGKVTC